METESNYNKRYFKFNLIPPLSKAELGTLEKRDNTLLYSFVLIFAGIFIYFAAILVETFIVQPRLNNVNTELTTINAEISSFSRIKAINGELFLKSKTLEPILLNDIRISVLLDSINSLLQDTTKYNIVSYERENLGTFVINVLATDYKDAVEFLDLMQNHPDFANIKLRNIVRGTSNSTAFVIAFRLLPNES